MPEVQFRDAEGAELEREGVLLFTQMGLPCVGGLVQAELQALDPGGAHAKGDHLEFDLLVPYENVCLVGEITARSDPKRLRDKYERYIQHLNLLRHVGPTEATWRRIGVPEDRLREFRKVREIRGLFIATRLGIYEAPLRPHANVVRMYREDWTLLRSYVTAIGDSARFPFLATFELGGLPGQDALYVRRESQNLVYTPARSIAQGVGPADVFTFETSPYKLLPLARVFRRDLLPSAGDTPVANYQRPLMPEKLEGIRRNLLCDRDFMFPVSILVVLSAECRYEEAAGTLTIPADYGAVAVIDGQHRLFSYASPEIKAIIQHDAKMMVTAVRFNELTADEIVQASARMFVEINTNQTRVARSHLDAIAFPLLGDTSPRALAAQVLQRINNRAGSPISGHFDVEGNGSGVPIEAVLGRLARLVDRRWLRLVTSSRTCESASEGTRARYAAMCALFDVERLEDLEDPELLVQKAGVLFGRFLTDVKRTFRHDWHGTAGRDAGWFASGTVMAALTSLLLRLAREGQQWADVSRTLEAIRAHVVERCGLKTYDRPILDSHVHPEIPDPHARQQEVYRFLSTNRTRSH